MLQRVRIIIMRYSTEAFDDERHAASIKLSVHSVLVTGSVNNRQRSFGPAGAVYSAHGSEHAFCSNSRWNRRVGAGSSKAVPHASHCHCSFLPRPPKAASHGQRSDAPDQREDDLTQRQVIGAAARHPNLDRVVS